MTASISRLTRRRFILGCQGLWPGRRATGLPGARAALRRAEVVQVDPLNVVARSHDLVLHARVNDYRPQHLEKLLYQRREFFDYGGLVLIVPMAELPYWRVHMRRRRDDPRWAGFALEYRGVVSAVRRHVRDCGPTAARDLDGVRTTSSFRSGKETTRSLYYLWLTGELMTYGRAGFDRVYGLRDEIAPPAYRHAATPAQAEAYFAGKALALHGLVTLRDWTGSLSGFAHRRIARDEATRVLTDLVDAGIAAEVDVDGVRHYLAADRLPLLEQIDGGSVPRQWRPTGPDTTAEVVFLAPLDIVSARGRAATLFGFEYLWEVYKPAAKRRWGYYTMPVLYGDDLVGRIDPRLDRDTQTLVLNGLWLEDDQLARDGTFVGALTAGLRRLAGQVGARRVDVSAVGPPRLRKEVAAGMPDE